MFDRSLPTSPAVRSASRSSALETHGDDPLGEWLLATATMLVEEGDDELEPLPEGVNELSDDGWREAAELA